MSYQYTGYVYLLSKDRTNVLIDPNKALGGWLRKRGGIEANIEITGWRRGSWSQKQGRHYGIGQFTTSRKMLANPEVVVVQVCYNVK